MAPEELDHLSRDYIHDDRGPKAIAVLWTTSILAAAFVICRCYVRTCVRNVFGADDALIVAAAPKVLLFCYAALIDVAISRGMGRHTDVVLATESAQHYTSVKLLDAAAQSLVLVACSLGKAAFAVTLLRLGVTRCIRVVLWFIIVSINIVHVLLSLFIFVRCKDPRAIWMHDVKSVCWDPRAFVIVVMVLAVYSTIVDFALALLPWIILFPLQSLSQTQKVGIAIAMSLGIIAGGTSIVKTRHLVSFGSTEDFTYTHMPLIWWAGTECSLILIAATIPTLKPLLSALTRALGGSNSEESHQLQQSASVVRVTISGLRRNNSRKERERGREGQWSAVVANGEGPVEDRASDYQSDSGILETRRTGHGREGCSAGSTSQEESRERGRILDDSYR
ncbi:hypothetical protein ACRE_007450 [Hapsidospora chrysogenum ATCC 11550]|uniref:Rhodopsin domain-containing protein n=1 Tax=Hapsidospora chrysogenum (strain ATCC 11550 / CBS 779.69 / DSM 880 / IAM 14645 / JCM 23072 / IMI 49137) TaxID=857340 RepID=A0A086TGM9_HAPC1|nr:hypothetical protein ACRE_007450 [Hapsidospora chrysogenum ATCC 11550]